MRGGGGGVAHVLKKLLVLFATVQADEPIDGLRGISHATAYLHAAPVGDETGRGPVGLVLTRRLKFVLRWPAGGEVGELCSRGQEGVRGDDEGQGGGGGGRRFCDDAGRLDDAKQS